MADILFLAHRLPYPPDRGDRIRSWHVLKALAKLGSVDVCALVDHEKDLSYVPVVESIAERVSVVVRRTAKTRAILHALASGRPASVEAFNDAHLMRIVAEKARHAKTIYGFSNQMAAYVPTDYPGRFIMDFVDMDSAKFAAMGVAGRIEGRRLLKWEMAAARRANVSVFVSQEEADLFYAKTALPAEVMGNGIDTGHFSPGIVTPQIAAKPLVVFTGQMDYRPNVDAVTTFVHDHLPQIRAVVPAAHFAIVGRAPTAAVRALGSENVTVTGEVPDTRTWLAAADVVVAPLSIARGVQNKVLEAMAMACACVVSRGAAQGIDAAAGRDLVIADDPVADVIALLSAPSKAKAMGEAGRARMVAGYGWEAQLAPLGRFLTQ